MTNTSKIIQKVFQQRQEYIIIGLTGRTGSGCTTVANILSEDKIELPEPINSQDITNDDRKYRIIYETIQKKWSPFTKIKVTDIITSFIFDYEDDFFDSLIKEYPIENPGSIQSLYNELKKKYQEKHLNLLAHTQQLEADSVYDFYFNDLPRFTKELKVLLSSQYTKIYQYFGNNLRRIGKVLGEGDETGDHLLCISERINGLIKLVREYNKKNIIKDYFVIDAFRNPFEALFFKERFSAFYLVSINTSQEERLERLLINNKLPIDLVEEMDDTEYSDQTNNFNILNIRSCIENADIHIQNPNNEIPESFLTLNSQLVRYVALIMHPGIVTPTKNERCMQIAYTAKFNSGCISRQVGAVVTNQHYSIRSVGWNDTPFGQVPCLLRSVQDLLSKKDVKAYSDYELMDKEFPAKFAAKFHETTNNVKFEGRNYTYCFKDTINEFKSTHEKKSNNQVFTRSLHAEENAFLQLAKYSSAGIQDGILFSTASPCELCSKKAYQLGIKKIIYIDPYPGIAQNHILNCGTNRPILELFSGAIGRAYHQLYEPIMPYKDELAALLKE